MWSFFGRARGPVITWMDACLRLRPFLLALLLQAAEMGSPEETTHQDLTCQVGDTATFPLGVPQRSKFSTVLWVSSSRGSKELVALWRPGDPFEVMSTHYGRRATFHKENLALEVHNLTKDDGGSYEVVEQEQGSEVLRKQYSLVVFDIRITGSKLANESCSLSLLCEAGAGLKAKADCSCGPRGPKDQGSALHLILHPADKDKSFTCTATALGTQHNVSVTPYHACSSEARAAGLLSPALLALLLLPLLL